MQYSSLLALFIAIAASTMAAPAPAPSPAAQLSATPTDGSPACTPTDDPFCLYSGQWSNPGLQGVSTTFYEATPTSTYSDPFATETEVYDPNSLPPNNFWPVHGGW
jgi:hypothetical protein